MKWTEQLQFRFPQGLGRVKEVLDTHIAINWEQQQQQVHGLYIIKAKVRFDLQPTAATEGILIEHLDLDEDIAYFEYGVPFEQSVENQQVKKLVIQDIQSQQGEAFQVKWLVDAQLAQRAKIEEKKEQKIEAKKEQIIIEAKIEEKKEQTLEDLLGLHEQFTIHQIRLNKI